EIGDQLGRVILTQQESRASHHRGLAREKAGRAGEPSISLGDPFGDRHFRFQDKSKERATTELERRCWGDCCHDDDRELGMVNKTAISVNEPLSAAAQSEILRGFGADRSSASALTQRDSNRLVVR